ncbi:MAG: hypothetical protein PHH88_00855, partial [Candidatus Pacebacteria bacterium]|nr:hypothetical protein [Candidatus Paceibacterota bacterium]
MNQPVVETLPDLYVGDIQYENGKMAIKIMNQGGVIDLCKENIYVEVANLNAGVWLTYPLRCENKEQLIDINNPFLYRLNIYNSLKVEEGHNLSVKLDYHNTIKESNENNNELKTTFNTYKNYENKVLYPTAGIFISSNIDIKWQGAKDTRHIIEVVSENGTGWHLSYDAKTDSNGFGKFIWDINSLGTEYGKFKIRIESQDATNKYSIDSGYFTIEEDVVEKILYPTANENFYEGKQVTIKWEGAKDTEHLIELLSEDGTGGHLSYHAKTDSNGLGELVWNVNPLNGKYGKYRISIQSQDATNKYSIASEYFTINGDDLKKYEKFGVKELVEDNLPNDITFWT